ncbi:MAG: DUF4403 family protein [Pseudomonadota bacterium]|nr:DUF4403 family protein [Pseudomonadota bacterium]
MFRLLLLSLQLLLIASANAQPHPEQQSSSGLPTTIEAPLRISLESIYREVEASLPQESGSWRKWKRSHGIDTKYRAWRGPLSFDIHDDVLTVQAHIRYWIRAHKRVLGALNLNSSCGVNEPPRQAIIGVQLKLGRGEEWMQRPQYRVLPTHFLDRCTMTIANIDVTPVIENVFHKQLKNRLGQALEKLESRSAAMQKQAQQGWSLLQQPLELDKNYWLLLRPAGYALSPMNGYDDMLELQLAVMMYPKLIMGSRPESGSTPLPPPGRFYPDPGGQNLHLALELDFAELGRSLTTLLSGQQFDFNNNQFGIDTIQIAAHQQQINITTHLSGAAAGTLAIKADLAFDSATQQLSLDNLKYDYTADSALQVSLSGVFYSVIRKALEDAANRQMQLSLDRWKQRLTRRLDSMTPQGIELDISALQLHDIQISMQNDGVVLDGKITGRAMLELR